MPVTRKFVASIATKFPISVVTTSSTPSHNFSAPGHQAQAAPPTQAAVSPPDTSTAAGSPGKPTPTAAQAIAPT
jgi:hypothetical protein